MKHKSSSPFSRVSSYRWLAGASLLAGALLPTAIQAQAPGSVDTGFKAGTGASGTNDTISALAVKGDNKIVAGGSFALFNGATRNNFVQLNADGSVDTAFNPGSGANDAVQAVAAQSDGKVLIGGKFTMVNGVGRNHLARLNTDGSVDAGFDPGAGANDVVSAIAVQNDGKVLVGGAFTTFNNAMHGHIVRLTGSGAVDTSFDAGSGASDAVQTIAVQADGKIIAGGYFQKFDGVAHNFLVRLAANGSVDSAFTTASGSGPDADVVGLAIQSDGKILLCGLFGSVNGATRGQVARLNADGSVDSSFDQGMGFNLIYNVAEQSDGKVDIGGFFVNINRTTRDYVAQLNADGSVDTGFDPGTGANKEVFALVLQGDGKVLVAGEFTQVNGVAANHIARLIGEAVPGITSATTASGKVGAAFSYQITASKSPASYGASNLPPGLSVNTGTGKITGTPTKAGTYHVTLTAKNSVGTGKEVLTLTINPPPPAVTSATAASATTGVAFSYQITATNSPTKYGESGLPAGLTINQSTGLISGKPTQAGTFTVTIAAFNNSGSGSAKLTLTVKAGIAKPVITSSLNPPSRQGVPFGYNITATNNPTSYGESGIPAGLTINQTTGRISGTPTKAGTYTVTIAAFNSAGAGTAKLTLVVKPAS